MSEHSSIEIVVLSTLCILKHLKSEIFFVRITHAHVLMDTLAVRMASYPILAFTVTGSIIQQPSNTCAGDVKSNRLACCLYVCLL